MLSSPCQPAVNSGAVKLLCFRDLQLYWVELSPSATSHHLKGATKVNASPLLWDHLIETEKNTHWHLIVKPEYVVRGHPRPGQIKAYLLGLDRPHTKSVGSCSLVDYRGLSREKGIRKISKLFALQSWHCGVEVNNPGEKHLSSIRYYSEQL